VELNNWLYFREIQIDATNINMNLTDWLVAIKLDSNNFDFSKTQPSGADIRFTDSDGTTLLDYWIEYYDTSEQEATIWVKVPLVPANQTKSIYIWYGNPSATNQSDDVSIISDPLNDGSCLAFYPFDGDANDYSGNGNNGVKHGTFYWPLGKFGKCCHPSSSTRNYISIPTITSTPWTISVWMMRKLNFKYYQPVIGHRYADTYAVQDYDWFFGFYNNHIAFITTCIFPTEINKWYHVVLTYKGNSEFDVYVDGEFVKSVSSSRANLDKIQQIGGFTGGFSPLDVQPCYFDHLHIFNRTLTENEITLLSQQLPSYSIGNEIFHGSKLSGVVCDKYGIPIVDKPVKIFIFDKDSGKLYRTTTSDKGKWEADHLPVAENSKVLVVYTLEGDYRGDNDLVGGEFSITQPL